MELSRDMRVTIGKTRRVGSRRVTREIQVAVRRWDPRGYYVGEVIHGGKPNPDHIRLFNARDVLPIPGDERAVLPGIFSDGGEAA